MRLLPAAPAALLVLAALPAPAARGQAPPPAHVQLCELRAKPGNAFTYVPPRPRPAAARPTGRQPASLTAGTIAVTYVGFSSEAQAAFQYAVDLWEPLISTSQTIKVEARMKPLGSGVLGSAGASLGWPDFAGAPFPATLYGDPLADALSGVDRNAANPAAYDIVASFNSSFPNWHFASDGTPAPAGKYDFVSVVLHELGHGLEFAGLASVDTNPASPTFGEGSIRLSGYVNAYDRFTVDASGAPMLSYTDPSVGLGTALQQPYNPSDPTGPGVYWSGPLGIAANGFAPPRLFTPTPWQSGSSYSHLDEAVYPERDPDSLMTPLLSAAETIHDPGPITLGMFADMGWNNYASNGTFDFGLDPGTGAPLGWKTFGDISFAVNSGVFEYYWMLDADPSAAVVFHETGEPVPVDTGIFAQFDLGNSSTVRKRISVLMHDQDFSDLSVCVFWLPPGSPLSIYQMYTHTTEAWAGATVSFYAATPGEDSGRYRLDNVSVNVTDGLATTQTICADPLAPTATVSTTGELLTNGDFTSGLAPWSYYGNISWRLAAGVFEFFKLAGLPSGVVLQGSGAAFVADQRMLATFKLGNSSGLRQRVTVLLHHGQFADLQACTFYLAPGQPLSTYGILTYATIAWPGTFGGATISVYPATVGTSPSHEWLQLDDVSLTGVDMPAAGTICLEPGATIP